MPARSPFTCLLPSPWLMAGVLALAAAWCSGLAPGQTSAPRDPTAEDAPAYNGTVARSFLIEVEPLVEKHTGWECVWPVPFRLVTRNEYVDLTLAEMRGYLAPLNPRASAASIDEALRPSIEAQAVGLLGRYSTDSRSLLLLPGNLPTALRLLGVEKRYTRDLVELVLAHELTHAVQDAQPHIKIRRRDFADEKEQTAWVMLLEGHASWVADCVARDLHLDEAAQRMGERLAATSHPARNAERSANTRGYIQGKKFVEAVFRGGGLPAVQALFRDPPRDPALIDNPQKFLAERGLR